MEEDQGEYPDSLLYHFPSQLRLDALPELVDISVSRTLLSALLTALKANGEDKVLSVWFKTRKWEKKALKLPLLFTHLCKKHLENFFISANWVIAEVINKEKSECFILYYIFNAPFFL